MSERESSKSIVVNSNVRALKVYPIENTDKRISELKTVGIKLSKDEAIHLARVLLAVTQDWDEIDITGFRLKRRRRDNTHQVTVTSSQ